MNLIMLGPPGAGKGTQADILSKHFSIPTISTGNILRAAAKAGSAVGLKAKEFMDQGQLVPDHIIIDVMDERLAQPDCAKGFILDGVPRTIVQAQAMEDQGIHIDAVVSMELDTEIIVARMDGRRVCLGCGTPFHVTSYPPKAEGICDNCGEDLIEREDDKPATVRARMTIYENTTAPLKSFYGARGKVRTVDTDGCTIQEITTKILHILEDLA